MKNLKILGLAAVISAALMALAGSAAATTVTTTTGGAASTPTIHAVNEGGHVKLANPIANIECSSTVEGKVENHGTGVTASGAFSRVEFTGCTNSWHWTSHPGKWEVHWITAHTGLTTWSNGYFTITRLGITCNYGTNNTTMGSITGGATATIKLEASIRLVAGSSGLCGSGNASLSGSLVTTSALY